MMVNLLMLGIILPGCPNRSWSGKIVDRQGIEEFNNWNLNRLGLTDYQQRDTGVCLGIKTGQSAADIII